MAKAIVDFRLQLTEFVDRVLEAEARGLNVDKQTIARSVFEEWAQKRHKAYTVYARALRADGRQMELGVLDPEEDGAESGRGR